MNHIDTILSAAKASHIPVGESGLWFIFRREINRDRVVDYRGQERILPAGEITYLMRTTMGTLHRDPQGEVVMEDTIFELNTHLGFILKASGNVLVTGLGLGCVVRGLLANPNVDHITCIEKSEDVLKLVQPHMPKERLTIIHADALEWTKDNDFSFDYAWHDLWTDQGEGEPHLDVWHMELITNCINKVENQGAWRLLRPFKRKLAKGGINLVA